MTDQPGRFFRFGDFSVDADKRLLWRAGESLALAPKVLETLIVFLESRGRVLTKEELLGRIWGARLWKREDLHETFPFCGRL